MKAATPGMLALPMVATDQTLLEALEEELLDPAVIGRTIEKAVAELQRDDTGVCAHGEALRRELATLDNQLGRLTEAIVLGGDSLPRLVEEMRRQEARRAVLEAEIEAVSRLSDHADALTPAALTELVEETLADYRGLLERQTTEARGILRELITGRVVYTPVSRPTGRWCEFEAECSVGGILRGAVDPNGGGPNGIRTRVSALRGPCPGPLDDGAVPPERRNWLGEEDSNPRYQGQNLASYH